MFGSSKILRPARCSTSLPPRAIEAKYAQFLSGFASSREQKVRVHWWNCLQDTGAVVWVIESTDRRIVRLHLFEQLRRVSELRGFGLEVCGAEEAFVAPRGGRETGREGKGTERRNKCAVGVLEGDVRSLRGLLGGLMRRPWDTEAFSAG